MICKECWNYSQCGKRDNRKLIFCSKKNEPTCCYCKSKNKKNKETRK